MIKLFTIFLVLFSFNFFVFAQDSNQLVLSLNGTDGYAHTDFGDYNLSNFTIETWLNVPTYDGNVHYISLHQFVYIVLGDYSQGPISTWAAGLSPIDVSPVDSNPATNVWHHFAFTFDGGVQRIYVDGSLVKEVETTGSMTFDSNTFNQGLNIGARYSGTGQFVEGLIEEVRIWAISRDSIQIRETMIGGLAPNYYTNEDSGLVAYWKFDQLEDLGINGDGNDDIRDFSINSNHLDLVGGALLKESNLLKEPSITSISDIPNDQGKQVLVKWFGSSYDTEIAKQPVTKYGIWKMVDQENSEKNPSIDNNNSEDRFKHVETFSEMLADINNSEPGLGYSLSNQEIWEMVGTSLAIQEIQYAFTAPTLYDSTSSGVVWSKFFISAHTENPLIWYASKIDSGFSKDNLAPSTPSNLLAKVNDQGVTLNWNHNTDIDFNYYSIYRDLVEDFIPSEPYAYTTDTFFVDVMAQEGVTYFYKLTATDFSGNESAASSEVIPTDIENDLLFPTEYVLVQNFPNPFNPSTKLKFYIPKFTDDLELSIYNATGQKIASVYQGSIGQGKYEYIWNGTNTLSQKVPSGVYFAVLKTVEYSQSIKMMLIK